GRCGRCCAWSSTPSLAPAAPPRVRRKGRAGAADRRPGERRRAARAPGLPFAPPRATLQAAVPTEGGDPMKRNLAILLLALFAATLIGGCNTIEGAGKDIEK